MACCAFAVFLLSQLLLPLRWGRDRLFGAPLATANPSVIWSPTAIAAPAPRRPLNWRPVFIIVLLAETAGFGVAVHAAVTTPPPVARDARQLFAELHGSLCSAVKRTLS